MIPKSKTGMRKVRLVDSVPFLKNYINEEHPDNQNVDCYIFVGVESHGSKKGSYGKQLDAGGARIMLTRTAKRAGIKKNIYPHLFRHTKLTHMASDFSEQEMKIFAGWSGASNMPQVYVHLSESDVGKKILEKIGLINEENKDNKDQLKPRRCIDPSCNHVNPVTNKFCSKCHRPLDVKTIVEIENTFNEELLNNEAVLEAVARSFIEKKAPELIERLISEKPEVLMRILGKKK